MTTDHGIRLEFPDDRPSLSVVAEVNAALAETGTGVWPLALGNVPAELQTLLGRPTLTDAEAERVRTYFLQPRERLLRIIEAAGRQPNVPGGGELDTLVTNEGYGYPQLWVVQGDRDYARFDRFHVNVADDGTGVDEVLQILSGGGVMIRVRSRNGAAMTLRLDCPRDDAGWLVTYDGGRPHMGSLSGARPGTKVMVQAIGPARWALRYDL